MTMREDFASQLLADVSDVPLTQLLTLADEALTASTDAVLKQVERPRANLGGSGPPGRAD